MNVYKAHKLTKTYNDRPVVNINNLEIEAGKIYGLLGPNGAGKSTLLNILGFLDFPTSGQLEFLGKTVLFQEKYVQKLRKEIVVLDQYPVLFTTTVFKNLEFGLKVRKIEKAKRNRIIDEALDLVSMSSFKYIPAHTLSGGETQRAAIARALALSPKVLLCDEPTASVDVDNQSVIVSLLKQINHTKKISIIFTTHDRLLAVGLAQHTLVLNEGELVPTSYENTFPCKIKSENYNLKRCYLTEDTWFYLASNNVLPLSINPRVFIDPEEILLSSETPKGMHYMKGKIVQLMEESSKIRTVVDVGFLLTILLTRKQYELQRPGIGDLVSVSIPSDAATLLA